MGVVLSPGQLGPAPSGYVLLTVTATVPKLVVDISSQRDPKLVLGCTTPCEVQVRPGVYTFRVQPTEDTLAGSRTLTLERDTAIEFDPDTRSHLHFGLGFIGLSALLAAVGGAAEDGSVPLFFALATFIPGVILTTTALKPEFTREDSGINQARRAPSPFGARTPSPFGARTPSPSGARTPPPSPRLALGWTFRF